MAPKRLCIAVLFYSCLLLPSAALASDKDSNNLCKGLREEATKACIKAGLTSDMTTEDLIALGLICGAHGAAIEAACNAGDPGLYGTYFELLMKYVVGPLL